MSEHGGLPQPFYDDAGFPVPLRHIHDEVRSRGGDIVGSGLEWTITHPDPELPDVRIEFYDEGEVLIDAGGDLRMDVFCQEAWRVGPGYAPWTHLEIVLLAFLEGGFSREVWRDSDGKVVAHGMSLQGSLINEAGGTGGPEHPDAVLRESAYPAWPEAGGQR